MTSHSEHTRMKYVLINFIYDIVTTWVTEGTMLSNQVSPIT